MSCVQTPILAAVAVILLQAFAAGAAASEAVPSNTVARDGRFDAGPLAVRNLSPVTQIYGLPRAHGAALPAVAGELTLLLEHSNNFTSATVDDASVTLDGTTTVTTLAWSQAAGPRLAWGLEVPLVRHSGGATDAFIDGWHDLFGLPDGDREQVPRNRLDYRISYRGETLLALDQSVAQLGDTRAWLGYRLFAGSGRQAQLRAMVKLPTGRIEELSGSDATDLSVSLGMTDRRTLEALGVTVTAMAAMTRLGGSGFAPDAQQDLVLSGHFGLHYPVSSRLTLRAQLDGHGEVVDIGLAGAGGRALQGTLGGSLALAERWRLDLGVAEDLKSRSSPDVVFLMTLGSRF